MNKQQFAPFYVGQEVEAIKNCEPPYNFYKKGQRFFVTAVDKHCHGWVIQYGVDNPWGATKCDICGNIHYDRIMWTYASSFRAITPAMEAVNFEKITEQHPVSVN